MARIRSIKPEIWSDEALGSCPVGARLLFIGMITQADDEGRLRAAPALLRSAIFPYDVQTTPKRVCEWLDDLQNASLVVLYQHNGESFAFLPGWKHQKVDHPTPSRLPPLPEPIRESSRILASPPRSLAPDLGRDLGRDQGSGIRERAIYEHWKSHDHLTQHREFSAALTRAVRKALKEYEPEAIRQSIDLYATVLGSDIHYWSHQWTLDEFMLRGLHKFSPETQPLQRYLKTEQNTPAATVPKTHDERLRGALARFAEVEAAEGREAALDWLENVYPPSMVRAVKDELGPVDAISEAS